MFTTNQKELLKTAKNDFDDIVAFVIADDSKRAALSRFFYNKHTDQVIAETGCELWEVIEEMHAI